MGTGYVNTKNTKTTTHKWNKNQLHKNQLHKNQLHKNQWQIIVVQDGQLHSEKEIFGEK